MSCVLNSYNLEHESIRSTLIDILKFMKDYRWIIDAYVSDYFLKNLSEGLTPAWRDALGRMEPHELASLLDSGSWETQQVWPLSLLAFRKYVTQFSLKRRPAQCSQELLEPLLCNQQNSSKPDSVPDEPAEIVNGQYLNLEHCYRRHVKPKKQHEILNLGKCIKNLSTVCNCDHVVDVGAGQGHLSRLLTFGYKFKVTTIEAIGCHAPKAEKFDREVKRDIEAGRISGKKKKPSGSEPQPVPRTVDRTPQHVIATIDPSIPVAEFLRTLRLDQDCASGVDGSAQPTREMYSRTCIDLDASGIQELDGSEQTSTGYLGSTDVPVPSNFILTGLHACGDLTATMLRVFVQCPQAVGLASVGCCYMKLTTQGSTGQQKPDSLGYPMSQFVNSLPDHKLSYEGLEMACHFIDCYHERLKENSLSLHSHSYRAALQEVIEDKQPGMKPGCIKLTIKNVHELSFEKYASTALIRLKLDPTLTAEQLTRADTRLQSWKDVVAFYALRLSLAPLLETLVLLDRVLFLMEKGVKCCLRPIFDPKLSPRNFVLLAKKSTYT